MIMANIWNMVAEFATTVGINLVLALVLLLVGMKLIRVVTRRIGKSPAFSKIDPSAQTFFRSFASIVLTITLVMTAAGIVGVPLTSVMAILASAGLAIGLALQGALGNLAGGLIILIFKPFRVGDYVDTQGGSGTVKEINIFYTILITADNQRITLPNGTLTNSAIVNYSTEATRRINLEFTVPNTASIEEIKQLLLAQANRHPAILSEPEPFCRLVKNSDKALIFALRVWCPAQDYWNTHFDLLESIKNEFDLRGIKIPNPQMDVYINR